MSFAAGSTVGAYQILASLGAGGMGEVYRARDARLGREVAIKLLPASLSTDPIARERLRREAVAAAGLDHPFVCKVFEIGDTDGHLFIVMELVAGDTLHARLGAGAVSLSEALTWAVEIAEALEAAHARQIVHRDLKPSNVMVGSQGHVKVMDFGLAKDVSRLSIDRDAATRTVAGEVAGPLTDRGVRVGTPGYMAPEQIVGDEVDGRTDIFALGVLLCEAVSGVHPFRRPTLAATASAILGEAPLIATPPSGDLPAAVRQILQRMLAKAPDQRYQSMTEVRRDLVGLGSSTSIAWSHVGGARWASADRIGQARRWPMVGRDAERAELMTALDQAMAGHGGMVLIGGEPGIGKTRLTEAILTEARTRGCMCLVGHAYEMEGAPPYVPFIEMLEYSARVVPPAAMRHALGDAAPEVAKLMPELRHMFPNIPAALDVPAEQQRRLLFNAYRDFVERSCAMAPMVTVLEDLHWADEATLALLLHLAPAMASIPILVIGTYRDVELDVRRPFAKVLETLLRQRLATRMALKRLPAEGVSELLRAMGGGHAAPPSLCRIIFDETEGNPFFVEEVFQHLKEEGRLFDESGQWRSDMRVETLDVPEGVRLVIGRRLERLSEQARRVLTTAAVIGRSFSLPLLESLESEGREDQVLDAIEEAEQAQLVAAQQAGRETRYLFAHELIRQTLAEALSMPRRQRLHAKIAAAIERLYAKSLGKHAASLAHHLYQAGAASDPSKTTEYLVAAADEARAASAPEDALRCLDQALSLWDNDRGSPTADLHDRRGRVLRSLGRPQEAVESLKRALALWDPRAEVDRLVSSAFELGMTYMWQADTAHAVAIVRDTLARIPDASLAQRFTLLQWNAVGLALAADTPAAIEAYRVAQEARKALNSPTADMMAIATEGHFRWATMDLQGAAAGAREAMKRLGEAGLPWLAADASWIAPLSDYFFGRFVSFTELDVLQADARRVGHGPSIGILELLRAYLLMQRGDLTAAVRVSRESMAFNRAMDNRWGFFATFMTGFLEVLQGREKEGLVLLQEAEDSEPPSYWLEQSRRGRFWALAHLKPSEALAMLASSAWEPPDPSRANPFGAWVLPGTVVPALAVLGRREEAAAYAPSAKALIDKGLVCQSWSSSARLTAAIATGCAREWDESEAYFREALNLAAKLPMRPEEAIGRVAYADMLRHRDRPGDRDRARVLTSEAEALSQDLGMALIERHARALRGTL